MSVHQLKTTRTWFRRVKAGEKTAEIRKHDRDFQVGDVLDLLEIWEEDGWHYEPPEAEGRPSVRAWHKKGGVTGDCEAAVISHVLPAAQFPQGLQEGYCLLSFYLTEDEE